jgi:predicted small metal-binding protein
MSLVITLRCPIGECVFEIDAHTFEEAIKKARDHARAQHNMIELAPHIIEKIAQAFKPTIW